MSPVVLRARGFVIVIFALPREHRPAHVHMLRAGTEVRIRLGDPATGPVIMGESSMRASDRVAVLRLVAEHAALLHERWSEINGKDA
jgi:hypothetical protein